MKLLKSRILIYFALAVLAVSFIGMIAITVVHQNNGIVFGRQKPQRVQIIGEYSLDGGEWQDTIPSEMIHSRFHTATIKGLLSRPVSQGEQLVIFADNIFFTLESEKNVVSNEVRLENGKAVKRFSPGLSIYETPVFDIYDEEKGVTSEVTITLTYPYSLFSNADLSDFFEMYITGSSGVYELLLTRHLPSIIFCLMICFFGLFAFPIAGSVIGGINMRYWAFSVLCFFTGIHLLVQTVHPYLPLWIDDPTLCMTITEITSHLFGICALVFICVILKDSRRKVIGNIILALFSVLIIALFIFNRIKLRDLYSSNPLAQGVFAVCSAVLTVCLFREIKSNRDAKLAIFTLVPLGITLLFDTLNMYFGFSDLMLFEAGVAVTLIIQIINLLYDLRQQHKETIRYQQIQRELYESRVAIMVSQIQPHFLYNSLSSIAMLCTLDPETAQEATVTFADYLRGNMDSLKQKTPVPFSKELEHLKKYLYIEKLRFGKKLNVEYDIETEDFVLPQLSIQPLAENAVKHGLSKKRGGGTLTIATRELDDRYEITVSDDGKGFDVNEVKNDGRSHVGMDNVRRRLKEMCDGEVKIESTPGEGTVATVILPKEGQNSENTLR